MTTIDELLREVQELGLERLDAQLLLLHALDRRDDRAWLMAHGDETVLEPSQVRFRGLAAAWTRGEPLAYLTGHKEFFGLPLMVDRRVLVPRPDTETLVEWALEVLADIEQPRVLDLGTGSGAIALAVRHAQPKAHVTAVDISEDALAVARRNGELLGLTVNWMAGSWYSPIAGLPDPNPARENPELAATRPTFHLIVSNPPYVAEGDPHLAALHCEPEMALTAGKDGLDALRAIIGGAPAFLAEGGHLLLEHGWDQALRVRAELAAHGFTPLGSRKDIAGIERCSGGSRRTCG